MKNRRSGHNESFAISFFSTKKEEENKNKRNLVLANQLILSVPRRTQNQWPFFLLLPCQRVVLVFCWEAITRLTTSATDVRHIFTCHLKLSSWTTYYFFFLIIIDSDHHHQLLLENSMTVNAVVHHKTSHCPAFSPDGIRCPGRSRRCRLLYVRPVTVKKIVACMLLAQKRILIPSLPERCIGVGFHRLDGRKRRWPLAS